MADVDRVAEPEHGISEAFEVGLPVSEVSGRLLQPLAEPLCVLRGLSVSVGGHEEHTHRLVGALDGEVNTAADSETMKQDHLIKNKERIQIWGCYTFPKVQFKCQTFSSLSSTFER